MSTNSECQIIEIKKDQWFYILEDGDARKNAWDWRVDATAYGPFENAESAKTYLLDNHCNPGGWSESPLAEGEAGLDLEKDSVLKKLIEVAVAPRAPQAYWRGSRY